jgi:hypothetical protein
MKAVVPPGLVELVAVSRGGLGHSSVAEQAVGVKGAERILRRLCE